MTPNEPQDEDTAQSNEPEVEPHDPDPNDPLNGPDHVMPRDPTARDPK